MFPTKILSDRVSFWGCLSDFPTVFDNIELFL